MADNDIWGPLAAVVQERLDEVFEGHPETALEWLTDCLGTWERGQTLLGGCELPLPQSQLVDLCEMLELDADVVSALVSGASNEVLLHVTGMTLAGCPPTTEDACAVCLSLHERHERARGTDERNDLEQLALDVLAHIRMFEPLPPAENPDASPISREIHGLLSELPHSSRLRVLATAYEEHERTSEASEVPLVLQMFDALPVGCRALVGYLARRPEGVAPQSEVERDLELTPATLAEMEHVFESVMRRFQDSEDGEPAVQRLGDDREPSYRISPTLLHALRARRRSTD